MPKPGSNLHAKDLRIDHATQMKMVERDGADHWTHPGEAMDPPELDHEIGRIMDMAASLSKILSWISEGAGCVRKGKEFSTLDLRTWAMLYVMRPDLLGGETMRAFALRRGVKVSRVHRLVQEFRDLFPGVQFTKASRVASSEPLPAAPGRDRLSK
jgi:hypothetical protein